MAKTNAERQKAYRARRFEAGANQDGEYLLNAWIASKAHHGLARLAKHYGVTKKAILEKLLTDADDALIATLELDSPEWEAYFMS